MDSAYIALYSSRDLTCASLARAAGGGYTCCCVASVGSAAAIGIVDVRRAGLRVVGTCGRRAARVDPRAMRFSADGNWETLERSTDDTIPLRIRSDAILA